MKNKFGRKNVNMWLVIVACFFVLVACSENEEKVKGKDVQGDKATLAFSWSPTSLDPHGNDSWEVMRTGTAETLIKLNDNLQPTSWLASTWKQEQATTWVLQLQDNVKFHNGKVMNAQAVKESLQRTIEKNPSTKELLKIKTIEALSENELKIETSQPNAALISHLADPSTIIVDVESLDGNDRYPAFTGAFYIDAFLQDDSLMAKRFEDYWGEKATLSEVTIKYVIDGNTRLMALQSGDVDGATDIAIDNIPVLEKNSNFEILTAPSVRTHMLMYNFESPLFKSLALRKAVDTIVPRDEIVSTVMRGQGTAATSPFSPVLPFSNSNTQHATESVDQLMTQEGWKKNKKGMWEKDGNVFQATLLTFPQRPELTVMAEVIQSALLEEGMKVTIRQVENIDDTLANEEWDLSMYSMLTAHTGDPQYFLEVFYLSNSPANLSKYTSDHVDQMIHELSQKSDIEERNGLAISIQEKISEDIPQSFIVFPNTVFAIKKELKGFIANPIEYYYNNAEVSFQES